MLSLGSEGHLATSFFALHITGGYILLPILTLTFLFSKRVRRPPTVINFCVAWSIFSISYSLLMFISPQERTLRPTNIKLCNAQSALIHGVTPMAAVASFGVVAQVFRMFWLSTQTRNHKTFPCIPSWCMTIIIVLPPYLTLVIFAAPAAYIGHKHPEELRSPSGLWCTLSKEIEPFHKRAVEGFSIALAAIIFFLEVVMIVQCFRSTLRIKKLGSFKTHRRPFLSPFIRVLVFTLYTILAVIANIFFIAGIKVPVRYMAPAALPLCAAVVFGSQNDIFFAWLPWAKKSSYTADRSDELCSSDGGWSTGINEELTAVTQFSIASSPV